MSLLEQLQATNHAMATEHRHPSPPKRRSNQAATLVTKKRAGTTIIRGTEGMGGDTKKKVIGKVVGTSERVIITSEAF